MKLYCYKTAALALVVTVLGMQGCTSYDVRQSMERVNQETMDFTQGALVLATTPAQREQRQAATQLLLAKPVGQTEAVQLLLANSPAFQALLAQNWAQAARVAQEGRIPNPVLEFERVVSGSELDLTRFLTVGLLDMLTLPQRASMANARLEQAHIRLAAEVVDQTTRVRQAWVRAVGAAQSYQYAVQVVESAQASAELARRMESVGNFNKLTRARHHAFYADAAMQIAAAQQEMVSRREALVRALGLDDAQAKQLLLANRLPSLPKQPLSEQDAAKQFNLTRLDIGQAKAGLNAALKAQGLSQWTSYTDIELTLRSGGVTHRDSGATTTNSGYSVGLKLPIFDGGNLQRDAMSAQSLSAVNQLEATVRTAGSSVREHYAAYRTAYDISQHYKNEIIPLRKVISDENVLRYNGMLIGVFELLADSRDQIASVIAAIAAEQQFWLADAALKATLIGQPTSPGEVATRNAPSSPAAGH